MDTKKYAATIRAAASAVNDVNAAAKEIGQTDFFAKLNIYDGFIELKIGSSSAGSDYVQTSCPDTDFLAYAYSLCLRWLKNMREACKAEEVEGGEA